MDIVEMLKENRALVERDSVHSRVFFSASCLYSYVCAQVMSVNE